MLHQTGAHNECQSGKDKWMKIISMATLMSSLSLLLFTVAFFSSWWQKRSPRQPLPKCPLFSGTPADFHGPSNHCHIRRCQSSFISSPVDSDHCKTQFSNPYLWLFQAGEGKNAGTDDEMFNLIFALRSWAHLRAVFEHYKKLSDKDIEESIMNEFSLNAKKAFLAIGK